MNARTAVVLSGLAVATLTLFGLQLFGWQADGWMLILASVVHLTAVMTYYPLLDTFLVAFHYLVALIGFAAIGRVLLDVVGAAESSKGIRILVALLQDHWSRPSSYMFLTGYVFLIMTLFLIVVCGLSWLIRRRRPQRQELLTGLFVASILNISCDFAWTDTLSQIVVLEPEESRAFTWAATIESLDFPVLLHGFVLLIVASLNGPRVAARGTHEAPNDAGSAANLPAQQK